MTPDEQQTEQERRPLVYVAAPPPEACPICGFELEAPTEAVHVFGRLAHVPCVQSESAAMRGGV